jgi:hypothetical protein
MTTTVYLTAWTYERITGALTGAIRIWPEPTVLSETLYRLPPAATLIEPPETGEHQRAVFLESTQHWTVVSDYRGEEWFDDLGRPTTVTRLGDPANWGWRRYLDVGVKEAAVR